MIEGNLIQERMKKKKLFHVISILVAVCIVTLLVVFPLAMTGQKDQTFEILDFADDPVSLEVEVGTPQTEIGLPETLQANVVLVQEEQKEHAETAQSANAVTEESEDPNVISTAVPELQSIPTLWECEDYDAYSPGSYYFTAILPENYSFSGQVPTIEVRVNAQTNEQPILEETPNEPQETVDIEAVALAQEQEPEVSECSVSAYDTYLSVPFGTEKEAIGFPKTLSFILGQPKKADAENEELPVNKEFDAEWECENYDGALSGSYMFSAKLSGLENEPQEVQQQINNALMNIEVMVLPQDATIVYFHGNSTYRNYKEAFMLLRFVVPKGTAQEHILPQTLGVELSDGSYANIEVSWSCDSYNPNREGTYVFYMTLGEGLSYDGQLPVAHVVVGKDPLGM